MLSKKLKSTIKHNSSELKSIQIKRSKQSSDSNDTSPFFANDQQIAFWQKLYDIECRLSNELKTINFLSPIVAAVYNPIEYASDLHCAYLQTYLNATKSVLFIGMNPGPYGMCQTGVT